MKLEDFWLNVDVRSSSECWNWKKSCHQRGYGQFCSDYKIYRSHRFAYEDAHGPIPQGLLVRHSCHNPRCCNPEHLSVGTSADNTSDKISAGRQPRGSSIRSSKLTEAEVLEIRSLRGKMYQRDIALKFNITQANVSSIMRRQTWAHLQEDQK